MANHNKESNIGILQRFKEAFIRYLIFAKQNKLKSLAFIMIISLMLILLFVATIYFGAFGDLPTKSELRRIKNPITTTIYSGNKEVIGYFFTQDRSNMDSSQITEEIKNSLIATEDIRFYDHGGIDYKSLGRVFFKTILLQKKSSGGGSTITQQLAKNVFGRKKQFFLSTPINKIREMFIAYRLENTYTKDEILLMYLNTVPFGDRLYGLEKASKRFFNKAPEKLNLQEAATLIGTLKASTYYNPQKNPDNAKRRRNVVLDQMLKYSFIDSIVYTKAITSELEVKYTPPKVDATFAAYYKDFLRSEFNDWALANPKEDGTTYDLDTDGLTIYTSIHSSIQKSAEKAVSSHIERLQSDFYKNWAAVGGKEKFEEELIMKTSIAKKMANDGIQKDSILKFFNVKNKRKIWYNAKIEEGNFSILDSLLSDHITLQAGLVAIHAQSGKIMAYVGGRDYGYSQYDQLQLPKQVGSTFKPIVYLKALENGVEPCNFFDNELRTYENYDGWTPKNSNGEYGGSYSTYGALANSVNTVSVQMMFKAGMKSVVQLAKAMGITANLKAIPSLVLGTAEVKPIEMVSAFGSIANGGRVVKPYSILKILSPDGKVLYERKGGGLGGQIADENKVKQLQQMMTFTNQIGTGTRIQAYDIPYNLIAKTGTTQNNADGWYIASSPEITCGAWVGTMNPSINFKYTSMGSGSNTALPMVGRLFGDLSRWNTQIISNFSFEESYTPCVAKTDFTAEEAESRRDSNILNVLDVLMNVFQ